MFKSFGGPIYFVVALGALSDSSKSDIRAFVRLDEGAGVNQDMMGPCIESILDNGVK